MTQRLSYTESAAAGPYPDEPHLQRAVAG
eukprot:COSAG01_NODE_17109_length_1178_cov_0.860982_3_plen_28_part_01